MHFHLAISKLSQIKEIPGFWTQADFVEILTRLDFPDAGDSDPGELPDLLDMALSDLEPQQAAEVLLSYKLGDRLSRGQIQNLSHEMAEDNESEENANMDIHFVLFNINQLLRKAFNGIFPSARATRLDFRLSVDEETEDWSQKELVLKSLSQAMNTRSPLLRLFEKQLSGKEAFGDVQHVVWQLKQAGENSYEMITSDYWINEEDLDSYEQEGSIKAFENQPGAK